MCAGQSCAPVYTPAVRAFIHVRSLIPPTTPERRFRACAHATPVPGRRRVPASTVKHTQAAVISISRCCTRHGAAVAPATAMIMRFAGAQHARRDWTVRGERPTEVCKRPLEGTQAHLDRARGRLLPRVEELQRHKTPSQNAECEHEAYVWVRRQVWSSVGHTAECIARIAARASRTCYSYPSQILYCIVSRLHRARPPAALARIISPLKPYYTLSQSGVLSLRPAETVTHPRTLPPLMDCAGVLAAGSRDPLSKGTVTGSTARARERGQHHWQSLPISLISPSIVDGWDGRGLNGLDGRQGCTDARLSLPDEAACVRSRGHTPNVPISLISISLRQLWMGWTEWIGLEVWMHRRQRASFYTYRRAACVRACVRSREGPAEPCGLTSVRPSVAAPNA